MCVVSWRSDHRCGVNFSSPDGTGPAICRSDDPAYSCCATNLCVAGTACGTGTNYANSTYKWDVRGCQSCAPNDAPESFQTRSYYCSDNTGRGFMDETCIFYTASGPKPTCPVPLRCPLTVLPSATTISNINRSVNNREHTHSHYLSSSSRRCSSTHFMCVCVCVQYEFICRW